MLKRYRGVVRLAERLKASVRRSDDVDRRIDRGATYPRTWREFESRTSSLELSGREVIVMLGEKVTTAFGLPWCPFTVYRVDLGSPKDLRAATLLFARTIPSDDHERYGSINIGALPGPSAVAPLTLVCLPHPSGLSRGWAAPGSYDRARAAMRLAGAMPQWEAAEHPVRVVAQALGENFEPNEIDHESLERAMSIPFELPRK